MAPSDFISHSLWFNGPDFLLTRIWPSPPITGVTLEVPERRLVVHVARLEKEESPVLVRFSTMTRLRVTACMKRWIGRFRGMIPPSPGLTPEELRHAELLWIRHVQAVSFESELRAIDCERQLPRCSSLLHLTPFKDVKGILRVGGRLKHALLCYDERYPIILPPRSHFTRLVIDAAHRRMMHGGVQLVLATIRGRYWVSQGRRLVKEHVYRCPLVRWRAAEPQPQMSCLPESRVLPCRPFLRTGLRLPEDGTTPGLFFSARLEGEGTLRLRHYSSSAYLAAFWCFTSRRGACLELYSDCGTTFIGADKQLRTLFRALAPEAKIAADQLVSEGTWWHFNPPGAPHFGGLWEAAVKSIKHHLRRMIGVATFTYEEMATLLSQVEACLNSRPLRSLTDDPDDLTALTPGHLLIG
ncbi:uncharacterized protein LOC105185864 [Harpegnathos saltator]|uniref:uncharacterized protein LOC105185864 n=1 Tax=Harpegnathos saltator TaxID=610380 RepID=UPI000DBEE1FA|nr:uncharacterized protein LOC105185864 [Harpegnathos saltator]